MTTSFIHCNQCFCRPTREIEFILTSCGHLFCASCICKDSLGNGICALCKTGFNRIKLTSNLSDDVKMYFNDPVKILSKAAENAIKVISFQKGHLQRYVSHCEVEMKKCKAENIRFRKREEQLMRALSQKEREINHLRGNRSVNPRMFNSATQQEQFTNEQFNNDEFVSPFGRATQPSASSRMYSQSAYPSQRFQMQSSRLSLDPKGAGSYYRRQSSETPMSINMKSMSASSGSTYYSADRVLKKSAKVSPFPPSDR